MGIVSNLRIKRLKARNNQLKRENRELSRMVDRLNNEIVDNEKTIEYFKYRMEEQYQEIQKLKKGDPE